MANLFTSQTPSSGDNSDGSPGITLATALTFAQDGNVTAIRFYATATVSGTYTVALYEVTAADPNGSGGTLLNSATMGVAPTAAAWNSVTITTTPVVTTKLYKAAVFSGAGRYVLTPAFGFPLVNGDITAPANGSDPVGLGNLNQGSFTINASLAYPTGGGGSCYFVDVEYASGTGVAVEADSAVTVTAGRTTAAAVDRAADSTVTVTAGRTSTAAVDRAASTTVTGTATVTTAATVEPGGASAVSVSGTVTTAASVVYNAQSAVSVSAAVSATAEPDTVPAPSTGNWDSLGAIYRSNAEEAERERTKTIVECPVHFYPLEQGAREGVLHCKFGGELWNPYGKPIYW